ncbi:M28 family peptidase [Clostridium cylindrosporum]|uniref:Peptidase M28 n=1 Tax=Clostridium cylindrosporum DSM 605 TaxID=1121307 RepID=A0A0J8D6V1_CLOCY|nr:M28 family peptidase [Clostridium cylindrosporum]KMT21805.1 peptidase M28 [Clostridium cylindrosporum DSM 605]
MKYPTIEETVTTLASDKFEGRAVGLAGNEATAEYIEKAFKSLNLTPLFEDSYYQTYYQAVKSDPKSNDSEKKLKQLKNVIGLIKGKNPKKAVIVSAHFDHIGYKDGNMVRGALDNASGVSALLEIANILKKKSSEYDFETNIIFCAFNSEERAYGGSGAFNRAIGFDIYSDFYNINIDCIGAKEGGKLALKNRGNSSNALYDSVKSTLKKNKVEFSDKQARGGSDHVVFDSVGIPNIYITEENILELIHRPTDIPEILDYGKIRDISRALSDFIISNDKTVFMNSK